jgi:hypothetical protein
VPTPKPFTVFRLIPGQNPEPLFVIHAYSADAARALAASKVAGTIVVRPTPRDGGSR